MKTKATTSRASTSRGAATEAIQLGDRVRQLRSAAGLTQSDLAGDRFSKEYVSQIERGKTRPTRETIEWLAARLGVDAGFLASGVAADERGRLEAALARAEALYQAGEDIEAVSAFDSLVAAARVTGSPELQVRALVGTGRAKMRVSDHRVALELFTEARGLAEAGSFSDVERADVLLMLGACRFQLNSTQSAIALFGEGLALAERSGMPCDALKADLYSWRARCWRRQRDYEAARDDVERALELAQGVDDLRTIGVAYFQASLVADRQGHWVLARTYAERAREAYAQIADRVHVGDLTNNLGGLNFLLGKTDDAIALLKEAFAIGLETGRDADAGRAVSSLAQVHLRTGDPAQAEEQARHALRLLDGRVDYIDEVGNAQVVLGRALLELGRLDEAEAAFRDAEVSFAELGSASHRATVWVARGDLAAKRGDHKTAADLYRSAAEALQDVRF
jgi:tetratricopeptide (TPR) repeat protein